VSRAWPAPTGCFRRHAPPPLAIVGAGHVRENGLTLELLSQTIMTGIWSPPFMKIIPSPPGGGERVRVRGVYFHGKKTRTSLCAFAPLRETFWLRPSALVTVVTRNFSHSEKVLPRIPRLASRVIPESIGEQGTPRIRHHLPPYSRLQIPHPASQGSE
jgi:hypothetical protein